MSKTKSKELDVDFIDGQDNPLTKEEQLAISAFIKQLKEKQNKSNKRRVELKNKALGKRVSLELRKQFYNSCNYQNPT